MISIITEMQCYTDKRGKWRWRLVTPGNHKKIASSHEGYNTKAECIKRFFQTKYSISYIRFVEM